MNFPAKAVFDKNYQLHLKHLKLKGLQSKTIGAYSRAIRRIGERCLLCCTCCSPKGYRT
jgi:integrase/recombinase XerD